MTKGAPHRLWSTAEVAAQYGLSRERVRDLAKAGLLPYYRVGRRGHLRFDQREVRAACREPRREVID